jgi:F0F1-type ATP synthase assembly protein I
MNDWGRYVGLGMLPPAGVVVGYFSGRGLDQLFQTHFLTITCLLLGAAGGLYALVREVQK